MSKKARQNDWDKGVTRYWNSQSSNKYMVDNPNMKWGAASDATYAYVDNLTREVNKQRQIKILTQAAAKMLEEDRMIARNNEISSARKYLANKPKSKRKSNVPYYKRKHFPKPVTPNKK